MPPTTSESVAEDIPHRRALWPLVGAAAGALGIVATLVTDLHVAEDKETMTAAMIAEVDPTKARIGFYAGYLTVGLLLLLAASWRRRVEPRVPGSTAARVVSGGLTAAAGALALGYGWKGAFAIYGHGASESSSFDDQGRLVYFVLNDFGGYIGWLGVLVAACAVAWMALRERTVSRWIGWVSVLFAAPPIVAMVAMAVPGLPALTMPAWLIVTCLGLTLGRSTITR
ncbi:hypothetical protein GTZ85_32135 [Streptomyces sp. SID5474]|nr:hypothetical protein [Streptomyces sp. SID5474]